MNAAILMAAAVVISYTLIGGMYASAVTDVLQGGVLILGLSALCWVVCAHPDISLSAIPPERLSLLSGEAMSLGETIERWSVAIFSTLISIELLSRVLATRSAPTARRATLSAGALYLLIGLLPITIGLLAPQLIPEIGEPEQVVSQLAMRYLRLEGTPWPELPFVIFAGALISAILSTVDSVLISGASALSHNLIIPALSVQSEGERLLTTRLSVAGLGVAATLIALSGLSIYELVEYSGSIGSAGLLVCFLFALFSDLGGERSALTTLALSTLYWGVLHFLISAEAPFTISLALSALTYPAAAYLFNERWNERGQACGGVGPR